MSTASTTMSTLTLLTMSTATTSTSTSTTTTATNTLAQSSAAALHDAGDTTLRRWLSLLNDTEAAQYYNDTRQYWPSSSEELTPWTFRHDWLESLLLCVAYLAVFMAGVLGNLVVIWIVRKTPQLRTTTNQFIVSLAAADLMVNCLCLPFTLVANLFKG